MLIQAFVLLASTVAVIGLSLPHKFVTQELAKILHNEEKVADTLLSHWNSYEVRNQTERKIEVKGQLQDCIVKELNKLVHGTVPL